MKPEAFIPKYETALASQDWSQVAPLVHKNAIVTFSDGAIHEGIANIKIAFERNFSIIKSEKYQVLNVKWTSKEAYKASYTFEFHWAGYINGKLMQGSGKGLCELVKIEGVWLMWQEVLRNKQWENC